MNKRTVFLSLVLAMSMLLFGCGGSEHPTETTAEATEPTLSTQTTEPAEETGAEPSIPHETHIPESSIITDEEAKEQDYTPYYDLLAPSNEGNALRDAMNCSFTKPEQMNLAYVFYGSLTSDGWDSLPEEAAAELEAAGFTRNLELQIRPAKELEKILKDSFGISLKDVKSGIPDSWVYLKSQDCYYTNHSDALGFPEFTITWAEKISDNRVELSYTIESDHWYDSASKDYLDHPNMLMLLEFSEDGNCKILSNYPVPSK